MRYYIAGECVEYDSKKKEIRKRFEEYRCKEGRKIDEIVIRLEKLVSFEKIHGNLSDVQCELIYSLQQFFVGLLRKRKLLLHASVVGIGDVGYIFIGYPNVGKSTIAQYFIEYNKDAYI